jgi:glyoxylase-like metal-dependent hydrolase (beta-lactamase superfamily II)/rhodanese-related sulfurtransferase
MVEILPIETPSLGDRSYLAHDGTAALVVDPQRDIDRVVDLADAAGVHITHVVETHIHNDYVTGGLALSRAVGARYLLNGADPVSFQRDPLGDGDTFDVGSDLRVRVLATPGHTFTHLSYVLESGGEVIAVFTGGSLLYGSTGRPDLLGPDHTATLARAQYASAQRLARELPDTTAILPTHGFGSFCAATQAQADSSTIGRERTLNPALTLSEQQYIQTLLAGLDAWPAYYAHMGPANTAGPDGPDLAPPQLANADDLRRRIEAGEWVVDLRDRTAFAAGFVPGSYSFTLDRSFASYLGWTIPWGTPITLLGATPEQVAQAQRELVRIGIDRPAAAATGQPLDWTGGRPPARLRLATFADLAAVRQRDDVVVLDVRRRLEWAEGHVGGAHHIPFDELPGRAAQVPDGEVWVYCRTGYRSTIAASILAAHGRSVVSIDDEFPNAAAAGLPLDAQLPSDAPTAPHSA